MILSAVPVLSFLIANAGAHQPINLARQNAASAPAGSGAASGAPAPTGAPAAGAGAQTSFSFSLATTNPTAIPLASIVSNAPSAPTIPLAATPTAGSVPSGLSGAPPLPNVATIAPSAYPSLDVVPPVDSPEVQGWIAEVQNSGVSIPNISVTVAGGCPANLAASQDQSRCWWTCGGCTRNTDITTCPDKNTWGLTYDDGPSPYTSQLLDYLDSQTLKATFFVVGSRVISWPAILQAEHMAGHQIAVHTWSHPSLTTLSNEQIIAELGWSRKVIKDVLGITPNMMRPPFGDIDDRVRAISTAMGLTPVMWTRISPSQTFDTDDFDIHAGVPVQEVLQNWGFILGNESQIDTGFIVLEHDLFQQTVEVATGYILPDALAHQPKFTIEPVVNCLHKPLSDAYIELNDNKTNPPAASGATTLSAGAPGSTNVNGGAGGTGSALSHEPTLGSALTIALACVIAGLGSLMT